MLPRACIIRRLTVPAYAQSLSGMSGLHRATCFRWSSVSTTTCRTICGRILAPATLKNWSSIRSTPAIWSAVATTEGAGRSATAQLLHASETAFWPDLPTQMAALMQTIPDLPGTEIILESTAYGFNDFHGCGARPKPAKVNSCPCSCPGRSIPTIADQSTTAL